MKIRIHRPIWGVPITFLGSYNPNQFEIVSFRKGDDGQDLVFTREREREFNLTFASLFNEYCRNDKECRGQNQWEKYLRSYYDNTQNGEVIEPIDLVYPKHKNTENGIKYDRCYLNGKRLYDRLFIRLK